MKIVHVGWGYPPTWLGCGPVIYVHTLAMAQRQAGHDALVLCASDQQTDKRPQYDPTVIGIDGVPYIQLQNRPVHMHDFWNPAREVSDPACRLAIDHVLRETAPDVIHIHNLVGLSFSLVDAAHAAGTRIVMSLHNYFPLCSRDDLFFADAERCNGPCHRSCSRCLGTMIGDSCYQDRHRAAIEMLNSCDALLPVSHRVSEIYEAHGVRRDLLSVERIGSATASQLWEACGSARVRDASPGTTPLRLVFFGALSPRKGVMTFLQAVRLLAEPERVEVHILGAAGPSDTEAITRALQTFSPRHAARLTFHGSFDQSALAGVLGTMDLAVLTPRWEDNGPQTVLEALAAGLPVIGTRVGGIPDLIDDGRDGILVEEGDPPALAAVIDRLARAPEILARLRANIEPPVTLEQHRHALDAYYAPAGAASRTPERARA